MHLGVEVRHAAVDRSTRVAQGRRRAQANLPTPLLPQHLLGPMHQRPHNQRQHRHRYNIQHNPHRRPIQLARLKRQLRERGPNHHRPRRPATPRHRVRRLNPVARKTQRRHARARNGHHSTHPACHHWSLYGRAVRTGRRASERYHWFVYVWTVAAYYFCFVGANIVAITYLLDSYPAQAGPLLVIICAFRGFISFGTSYGTSAFVADKGYDGAFGVFGALTAALGLLGVPVYFWGKRIRVFTGRLAKSKTDSCIGEQDGVLR